jgi:hypothetical protein
MIPDDIPSGQRPMIRNILKCKHHESIESAESLHPAIETAPFVVVSWVQSFIDF